MPSVYLYKKFFICILNFPCYTFSVSQPLTNFFMSYLISFIRWVFNIRLTDQFPPTNILYPKYFRTRWYHSFFGRFIYTSGQDTDDIKQLTYIIGRGAGYINSLQVSFRFPHKSYYRRMGGKLHAWLGWNKNWQNHNTPVCCACWHIAPRNIFSFNGHISTRSASIGFLWGTKWIFHYALNWGQWAFLLYQRYQIYQWNKKHPQGCQCQECDNKDESNLNYRAGYNYAAGYHD